MKLVVGICLQTKRVSSSEEGVASSQYFPNESRPGIEKREQYIIDSKIKNSNLKQTVLGFSDKKPHHSRMPRPDLLPLPLLLLCEFWRRLPPRSHAASAILSYASCGVAPSRRRLTVRNLSMKSLGRNRGVPLAKLAS